jgi:tRNA(Arg) A34 adenosine deaminase TadA
MSTDADTLLREERDCIVALGLLSHNFLFFDPAIPVSERDVTHRFGFNVHCAVIDNHDGQVLSIERNAIHDDENPLQHAEQRAIRLALERLRRKKPRQPQHTVEKYYKSELFMGPGSAAGDFLRNGCSLYNTFDPCAMCAVTLLICYMKRIVYIIEDAKYANFYEQTKQAYFKSRESIKERVQLSGDSNLARAARPLIDSLASKVDQLVAQNVQLIHSLDHCRDELGMASDLLRQTSEDDLRTEGEDRKRNCRTLLEFKRACNFPAEATYHPKGA